MGDNSEAMRRYRDVINNGDLGSLVSLMDELGHEDFLEEWPQSGERMRLAGAKQIATQYEGATGTSPKMEIRGIRESGDLAIAEGTIDYGNGVPVSYVGIVEFSDGKIRRVTEYFADPFEAPAWRAPFVEKA